MYSFIDQPVVRLGQGSRFILWAMRAWTLAAGEGRCPPGALAEGFAKMGVLAAVPDFHMALSLLNQDGLEPIVLAPMKHRLIAEDEAVLLGLWRSAWMGDRKMLCVTLMLLVDEDAVAPAANAMTQAALKLAAVDMPPSGLSIDTLKEAQG